MTIQEIASSQRTTSSPLALSPPRIPSAIANGGLRWMDLNDPGSPVLVQVVLSPNTLLINDRIDLYWQDLLVTTALVNQDHLTAGLVTLSVQPVDVLEHADGIHTLYYIATSAIGGSQEKSPLGTVKVKRLVPGGDDTDAGTPYINENLKAPTGIPVLIDDAAADQGVTAVIVVYDNMAAGDRIQLDWGGQRLTRPPLTEAEAKQPVPFPIPRQTLIDGPGKVVVRYDVRDEVNNWSKWSLQALSEVEVGGNLLPAPRVLDAVNGIIDLAVLGDRDARVQTPVYTTRMELDDKVVLTWTGYTAEGPQLDDIVLEKTVGADDIGWPLEFLIPNEKVRAIAQGNAVARYEVTPKVGQARRSRRTQVDVIGQVEQLDAPIVAGVVGDVLDPSTLPADGALVTIKANELIKAGDSILLLWDGLTSGGTSVRHTLEIPVTGGMEGRPIERRIPLDKIIPLQGGSVTVDYTLTKSGGATLPSEKLPLQVKSLGAQLPKPNIDFAQGDQLDPADVPVNGTTVRVNYSPMQTNDRIDMHWDGVLDYDDFFPVPANWGNKEVPFPVEKRYVDLNKDETVQVFYTVTRGGQPLPPSVKQPLLIGSALDLKPQSVKEASGNSLNPIAAKDTLTVMVPHYTGMLATDKISVTWSGTAGPGSHTSTPVDVGIVGEKPIVIPNSVVAFNLGLPVTVTYTVTRGSVPKPSDDFVLAVQPIANQSGDLPTPAIAGKIGDELDVSNLVGNEQLSIAQWPLQASGQRVWLRYDGFDENGNATEEVVWEGPPHNSASGLITPAPISWLKTLKDGSKVTVTFKVNFDNVSNASKAVGFPLRIYTVKAVVDEKPAIDSVTDANGAEIALGGITTDKNVTLKGTATKGQKVQVYDGPTTIGAPVDVNATNGEWTLPVTALSEGPHSFTAKALYGSGQSSTPPRTLTVTAVAAPTITSVTGSPSGADIAPGGTTVETAVTLSGTASKGQKVEILDGTVSKGQPTADVTTGVWTLLVSGLTVAAHSFTAKALYGTGVPPSAARTLTVIAVAAPTITSVTGSPSGADIAPGGTTVETAVTLSGTASKGQKVEILDGTVPKGQPTADVTTGVWTLLVSGLTVAAHSFTAKALYGTGVPPSAARTLTVVPELLVDTSRLTLNGENISIRQAPALTNWSLTGVDPDGTAAHRGATGGVPPITYESSNDHIASVDGNGVVRSEGNGTATITVRDNAKQSKSFEVTTDNVLFYLTSPTPLTPQQAVQWSANIQGLRMPQSSHNPIIQKKFFTQNPDYILYWSGVPSNNPDKEGIINVYYKTSHGSWLWFSGFNDPSVLLSGICYRRTPLTD